MPVPQIDTSLPADHSPINASELRTQFQGLQNQMNVIFQNPPGIASLNMTVSDPPAIDEVQAIADKVDEIISLIATWSNQV